MSFNTSDCVDDSNSMFSCELDQKNEITNSVPSFQTKHFYGGKKILSKTPGNFAPVAKKSCANIPVQNTTNIKRKAGRPPGSKNRKKKSNIAKPTNQVNDGNIILNDEVPLIDLSNKKVTMSVSFMDTECVKQSRLSRNVTKNLNIDASSESNHESDPDFSIENNSDYDSDFVYDSPSTSKHKSKKRKLVCKPPPLVIIIPL